MHTDHLGTPRAVSEGATVLWRWEGDAFGTAAVNEDVDADSSTLTQPLRFPGQYKDPESGLTYNYFRDYNPATGRYVQSDPIGLRGGLNVYSYVDGNPLLYTDPNGLQRWGQPNPRKPYTPKPIDPNAGKESKNPILDLMDSELYRCLFQGCLPPDLSYCRIARCYTCERGEWFENYDKDSFAIPSGTQWPPAPESVDRRKECQCISTGVRSNKDYGRLPGL